MRIIQKIVILLNFRPFTYIFHGIYGFGLRILVAALARQPAIYAIFGHGSFFEGNCLYGLSDIDLFLVIDERFARTDLEPHKITETYNRIRRFFPFLGDWHEKAESLIFMSEVKAGFPLLESFRMLEKQGRLFLLHGKPIPEGLITGTISINEVVAEMDTLLRMVLTKSIIHTSNLLFWKKIFAKLFALADTLGLNDLTEKMRCHVKLTFMKDSEVLLYIRKSNASKLFPLLLELTQEVFREIQNLAPSIRLDFTLLLKRHPAPTLETSLHTTTNESIALKKIIKSENIDLSILRSSLFGITPRFNYFPIDKSINIIKIKSNPYEDLREAMRTLGRYGRDSESFLIKIEDFLFILCKLQTHIDVVPLDPIIFANVHAQIFHDTENFGMIVQVYEEQKALCDKMFQALAGLYKKNTGWVTKMPFPCLYLEDDLVVIRDAFHRLRIFLVHNDSVDCTDPSVLVQFLKDKYSSCSEFLEDLLAYYNFLIGKNEKRRYANNLYRCLHQFMAQALSGFTEIHVDDHWQHLGITVGIITRNRAGDLSESLDSLARQTRPPDEVLIVDNGSTDQTRSVIAKFEKKLPVNYLFLEKASIPMARNMVIENARHEIISFTDDDCIVDPGWIDAIERGFLRADNIGIVGGWVLHEPAPEPSMVDTYYSLFHHSTT